MFTLHLHESPEDFYDCCCGCEPLWTVHFRDEATAKQYFSEEFGDGWYISTPEILAEERAELALHT